MLDRGEYGKWWPHIQGPIWPQYSFASMVAPFSDEELKRMNAPDFDPKAGIKLAPYADQEIKDVSEVPDCIKDVGDEWVAKVEKREEECDFHDSF